MLSNNTNVKNYFEQQAIQIKPVVSAEWNYNLIYQPYVTFSGDGTNLFSSVGGWKSSYPKVKIDTVATDPTLTDYYSTGVFLKNDTTRIAVNANSYNNSDRSNFEGNATIKLEKLPMYPSNPSSYKIVIYLKSADTNLIGVTAQASNAGAKAFGTTYATIDNFNWQKITLYVGADPHDSTTIPYNQLDLNLDFVNKTLEQTGYWGLLVGHIEVYSVTWFDVCYNNLWSTDAPFSFFRPGESYVRSGNNSFSDEDVARSVTLPSNNFTNVMPCSPIVYSPKTLFSSNANTIYKNGALSPISQYKYFVSELPGSTTSNGTAVSIGVAYEELFNVNKMVLKFNVSQSKPDGHLNLFAGDVLQSSIPVNNTMINDSGLLVLYYNGTTWSTNKWTWAEDSSSAMPRINNQGNITIAQKINKVVFTQTAAHIVDGYPNISAAAKSEFTRLQVIEISPRMELDLSQFVLMFDITKEIDNKSTPLPLSSISSNSAIIELSNVPLTIQPGNLPLSVFSTNANDAYSSPLKNLLVKNVKFYLSYYIPSARLTSESANSTRTIPAGVFYADTWDNQDIKVTKINCFDSMKFLQILPVNDYVSSGKSLIDIFTNVMDSSGFTDYDYNMLKTALTSNNQILTTSYFFADAKQKTVYDILREAFLAYQISGWIDEYGIMRFMHLNDIITKNQVIYSVKDSNVVVDTYNENIKTKIGKLIMRYRTPQIKKNVNLTNVNDKLVSAITQAPDIIWKQETEDLVPFYYLQDSILNFAQTDYTIPKNELLDLFYTTTINHQGYGFIEGEIVSVGDKEIILSSTKSGQSKAVYVSNDNDLNQELAKFSNKNLDPSTITYTPSGRFVNVQRGLFGTQSKSHIVMKTSNDFGSKLAFWSGNGSLLTPGQNLPIVNGGRIAVPINSTSISMVLPPVNEIDQNYNTYSVRFKLPDIKTEITGGLVVGYTYGGGYYTIGITSKNATTKNVSYILNVSSVNSLGNSTSLMNKDVTGIILNSFNNEPKVATYAQNDKGYISLKFVNKSGGLVVYINDRRITNADVTSINGGLGTQFGFYTTSSASLNSNSLLSEIYACQSVIDNQTNYHFQQTEYLDAIVSGKRLTEKFFMVQSRPAFIGLNLYDVQLSLTPSLGAEPFKVMYSLYYKKSTAASAATDHIVVYDKALAYSTVVSSGFRAKFALANNSRYAIWTQTTSDYSKVVNAQFMILSRNMIVLTDQQTLERVLNQQNINEVVEIQSDWIQSEKSANSILGVVARASNAFSKDITVNLFGNPLIQVGDIVSLDHTLKNIKNLTFFVQSVKQSYDKGLLTTLTMNEIGYKGTGNTSPNQNYLSYSPSLTPSNLLGIVNNNGSNTPYGSTSGGDVALITGGDGWSNSNKPTVFFDEFQASQVTVTSSSALTCVVPPHSAGWANVTVIFNGITETTFNYNSWLYQEDKVVLNPITPTVVSDFSDDASNGMTNVIAIDWTVGSSLENAYNFTVDGGIVPASGKLIDEGLGFGTKYVGSGFVPGKTYNFSFTPVDKQNGVQIGSGPVATLQYVCDSINQGGSQGGSNTVPILLTTPGITGNLTGTDFNYTVNNLDSNWIGFPQSYSYQWYSNKNENYAPIQGRTTYSAVLDSSYVGSKIYCHIIATNIIGQGSGNSEIIDVNSSPATGGGTTTPGLPIAPNIQPVPILTNQGSTSDFTFYINKDLVSNPGINSYQITSYPAITNNLSNEVFNFQISSLPVGPNNSYAITIVGLTNGKQYSFNVQSHNSFGLSQSSNIKANPSSTTDVVTNLAIQSGSNVLGTWTGYAAAQAYNVSYQSITNPTKPASSFSISKTGLGWSHIRNNVTFILSTNGINFNDSTFNDSLEFAPGEQVNLTVTPAIAGVQQTSTDLNGNYYTVPNNTFNVPTGKAPRVHSQDFHWYLPSATVKHETGGSFYWGPDATLGPFGSWASWTWEWRFYHGTSTSGTLINTGEKVPLQYDAYDPAVSMNMQFDPSFYVGTSYVAGPCYLEVRMKIIGTDGLVYYGNSGGAQSVNSAGQKGSFN
jgi:hypothetical protein